MIKHIKNKISRYRLIKKINKALNIELTQAQILYIFEGCDHFIFGERKQGKTTAHCIRLCIRKEPLFMDHLKYGRYSDMNLHGHYDSWFRNHLLHVREALKSNGIKVCDLIK